MIPPIRILLADDHAILWAGLRLLIDSQADLKVVGEAGDGRETIIKVHVLRPDLVLLDLNMPEPNGLTVIPILKQEVPDLKIMILTMHDDIDYLEEALRAGACGYVLKQAVDVELLMAIRAVTRGET